MAAAAVVAGGSGRALLVLTFRIVSHRRHRRRKLFQSVDVGSWDGPHATQKEYAYFSLNMEEWSIDRRRIAASRSDGRAITRKLLGSTFLFGFCFGAKISLHAIAIIAERQITHR